ncbi:MAG: hypothetical protein AB6733_01225 [Clostridiaceae bacterium]
MNKNKNQWNDPEFIELGVENTEKSREWKGNVDAVWHDSCGNKWESHS